MQTVFAKGGGHSLDVQAQLGYETIGLDWTVDPIEARKIVGENITLQGNLDPQDLYKSKVCFTDYPNNYFIYRFPMNLLAWN